MGTTASTVTAEQKTYPHFTYKASGSTKTGTIAPDGSLVLKLYYTRDTYTVTFVGNGGTLESGNATQTVRYGNAATIPTFARKGYTLSWDKESNAVAEDLTVTAQWSIDSYAVSYDVNGGEAVENPATYRITDDVTLDEPQREYYCFLGWYTASDEKVTNLQGYAGDLSLTAKWECFFTLSGNSITGVTDFCRQNVSEIVIPSSLNGIPITGISANAFDNYTRLSSVTIPSGITTIGEYAFKDCTGLSSVFWNATNCTLAGSSSKPVFKGCSCFSSVNIGESVVTIPACAFYGCTGLSTITIPDSVTSIGNSAFCSCTGLTSFTIGNGALSIGDYAFQNCIGLTSFTIPNSVLSIGCATFSGCTGLTSAIIGNNVTSIGQYAFNYCTGLTTITIPDSVTSIGCAVLRGCSSLVSVTIPYVGESKKSSGDKYQYPFGYFFGTSSYTESVATTQYYYGDSTRSTTETTYYIPSSLKSVTVMGGEILRGAFFGCSVLTSVTLGDNVTNIEPSAFHNCTGLSSIVLPSGVTSIGEGTFSGYTWLTSITIGNNVTSIGGTAFYGCTGLTSISIPDNVTSIGGYAFHGCTKLTTITIGDGVMNIGAFAFSDCTVLTSVSMSDSITTIEQGAFSRCTNLMEVYYTGDVAGWCGISFESILSNPLAYAGVLYINDTPVNNLVIPESVTTIGNYAFYEYTGLFSVTIGTGVTTIGNSAFASCTGLTSITYQGTKAQWKTISKGSSWNNNTGSNTIHCTDGDITV